MCKTCKFNCKCCKAKTRFEAYSEMTEASYSSIKRDLDLVRFIRAKRMHSFGLFFAMTADSRINSSQLAYTRPIRQ